MTLKELLEKNHFVEGSSAERLINIIKKQIGEDAVFEKYPNKTQDGLFFTLNCKFIKRKIINNNVTVGYEFEEGNIGNRSFSYCFRIKINLPNIGEISIVCDNFLLPERTTPNYKDFTICVVRFKDGVRDDLCYWPVDENGVISVTYDYRGGEKLDNLTLDDVLKAIEEENWEQILWCDFTQKHSKAK